MAKLTVSGREVLVDDEDLPLLAGRSWCANLGSAKRTHYAMGYPAEKGSKRQIPMHRLLMGLRHGDRRVVDHLNGNGLDNRRCNLEVVTQSENIQRRMVNGQKKAGFRGVQKQGRKWLVVVTKNYRPITIGRFLDQTEAARAYDTAVVAQFGPTAMTNVRLGLLPPL